MRALIAVIFGVVLALALTPVAAVAGPLEDGQDAAEVGDYATALWFWRPLAEQGHVAAQYNLGYMYDNGQGVSQDYTEAVKWYRLAAEQGHVYAQSNLSFMYLNGVGVLQDKVRALKWLQLAAEQGHDVSIILRDLIVERMTSAQVAEAQKLAREWRPRGERAK